MISIFDFDMINPSLKEYYRIWSSSQCAKSWTDTLWV